MIPPPIRSVAEERWQDGVPRPGTRLLAEEVPVALTYDGATHAVMMASPGDLADFAVGFSLTEGVIAAPAEIRELEIVPGPDGIDLRMWLESGPSAAVAARRRRYIGPAGCGMCGLESLAEAARSVPRVSAQGRIAAAAIAAAMAAMAPAQDINRQTHAVHAAGFWQPGSAFLLREDVGRHNALDKLVGALARAGRSAEGGVVVLSSRLSVELVQKAAMIGAPVLAAVSAPTALAVRTAEAAGITLVGIARGAEFEIFTHAARVAANVRQHVA